MYNFVNFNYFFSFQSDYYIRVGMNYLYYFMGDIRVKGPHNVGDFSGRSGRSPGPLLTYLGLYICSNAPKEGFPGIRQVFFD